MNERLFLELRRRGLHQYQLAALAQINETTLSRILWGRTEPALRIKRRIARALGLPVEELFSDNAGRMQAEGRE